MPEVGSALAVNFSLVGNGERIFRNQIERGVGAAAVTKNDVQAAIEAVFVGVLCHLGLVRYRMTYAEKNAALLPATAHRSTAMATGYCYDASKKNATPFKLEGLKNNVTDAEVQTFLTTATKLKNEQPVVSAFKSIRRDRV